MKIWLSHLRTPSTHSSMKVNERVWSPSPHISNLSVAVWAFLQKAAGAFSLPPEMQKTLRKWLIVLHMKTEHDSSGQPRLYLSKFQKVHRCYGTFQYGIQFQNPCCNVCTILHWQASPSRKHLEARTRKTNEKLKTITLQLLKWPSKETFYF